MYNPYVWAFSLIICNGWQIFIFDNFRRAINENRYIIIPLCILTIFSAMTKIVMSEFFIENIGIVN